MRFIEISDPHSKPHDLTQVFVHGYEGVRSENDIQRMTGWIRRAKPVGRCLLLCWGDWLDLPDEGDAFRRLAAKAESLTRETWEGRQTSWFDGVEAAASETLRFWTHAAEAEQTGHQLAKNPTTLGQTKRLWLWGHSLGARLLLAALSHPDWALPVERAVMLGAAADTDESLWRRASRHTHRLINVHSSNDLVLRVAPLWSPVAGLRPIMAANVENLNCGYQHHEYWPRLDELIEQLG